MTSTLLTPRRRPWVEAPATGRPVAGGTGATRILDWQHRRVLALAGAVAGPDRPAGLRLAHRRIADLVRPVYSVEDRRPVSEVLRRGRGSCSQRLALLEAVARANGTPTRVRGLLVDGSFWYPRFPRLRRIVPDRVVLAWPEFHLPGHPDAPDGWLPVSELFGPPAALGRDAGGGFTNSGPETLFEALARTAVDWDGATAVQVCPTAGPACDLSAYVLADLGRFDSRDALFARHGQTLCAAARLVAEPVLGRRSAGAQWAEPVQTTVL